MKHEYYLILKGLIKNQKGFLDKVTELAKAPNFNFEDLLYVLNNSGTGTLNINKAWFVDMGLIFSRGIEVKRNTRYAFALFQRGAKLNCQFAHRLCGIYYLNGTAGERNLNKATEHLIEAIRLGDSLAFYHYGLTLFNLGNAEAALNYFKSISENDSNFINAQGKMVDIYIKKKSYTEILPLFDKLLLVSKKTDKSSADAKKYLSELMSELTATFEKNKEKGTYKNVLEVCSLLANRNFGPACYLLGKIYLFQDKFGDAIRVFRRINKRSSHYAEVQALIEEKYQEVLSGVYDEEHAYESASETESSQKQEAKTSESLTITVQDPRWKNVNEDLSGFAGDNPFIELEKYFKHFHRGSKHILASESGAAIQTLEQQIELINGQCELEKKGIIKLTEEQIAQLNNRKAEIKNKIDEYNCLAHQSEYQLEGMTSSFSKARKRMLETESRFFQPKRLKHTFTKEFSEKILSNRLVAGDDKVAEIKIDAQPVRRLIAAEQATQQAAINLFGFTKSGNAELGYFDNPANKKQGNYASISYSNHEKLSIGKNTIVYKQRSAPNSNRLGDSYFTELGNYTSMLYMINQLTNSEAEKEKQLAKWMIRFSHDGKAISLKNLAELCFPDKDIEELESFNLNFIRAKAKELNSMCYLVLVKEISQWHLLEAKTLNLPFATAQARALKLLAEGYLRMAEVFGQDSAYGIFTGSDLAKLDGQIKMSEKMKNIDALYTEYLKHQHFNDYMDFLKSNKGGEIVATRQRIHKDLQEIYGGEEDTDGEGYESDGNSMTLELPALK